MAIFQKDTVRASYLVVIVRKPGVNIADMLFFYIVYILIIAYVHVSQFIYLFNCMHYL